MARVRSSLAWRTSPDEFKVHSQALVRSRAFDDFTRRAQRMDWGFGMRGEFRPEPFSVGGRWEMDSVIRKEQLQVNGFCSYLSCCRYPHSQRPSDTQPAWACHIHRTAPEVRIKKKKKLKFWSPGTNCCVMLWCRNEMFSLPIKMWLFTFFTSDQPEVLQIKADIRVVKVEPCRDASGLYRDAFHWTNSFYKFCFCCFYNYSIPQNNNKNLFPKQSRIKPRIT